jgi:hypothetical protein
MLFDLRSRRRRRVVKGVYLFLAVLIGVGLIGFGVGTGGNFGGLFNAAKGSGSASGQAQIQKTLTSAQRRAAAHPNDPAAWAAVGRAAYNLAQTYYVTNQGYTSQGFPVLHELQNAWNHYLAVVPAHPDTTLAAMVVSAMGPAPTGIEKWRAAESAQEIVVQATPNSYTAYANLAYLAYYANEIDRGDLAAARAVALAPKKQKKQLEQALATYKAQAQGKTGATSSTGSTGSTSSTSTTSTSSSTTH